MAFKYLPQELVEKVASYLSLDDILSCCAVNSRWRQMFNNNKIWFDLCSKRSPVHFDKFNYIEEPCSVSPRFEFFVGKCDSLDPVCKWRERFMQEAHLTRNWRHGRHSKHILMNYTEDIRDDYNFSNLGCDGNFVVIPYSERREFYVYNTRASPLLTDVIPYSLNYMTEDFFKLANKKVIVVQCTLLQVFTFSEENETFTLSRVMLFDQPEPFSEKIPSSNLSDWYESEINLYPCDVTLTADHNGQYFVGSLRYEVPILKPCFHIWDIETSKKIGLKYIPTPPGYSVTDITLSIFNSYLYIFITSDIEILSSVYRFEFNTLEFSNYPLHISSPVPYLLFSSSFVINVDHSYKHICFWDHNDSKLVHQVQCNRLIPSTLVVVNNHLLFAENIDHCLSAVKVIPLSKLETVYTIIISFNVTGINMVRDNMILVSVQLGLLLCDLPNGSILTILAYNDCLWSNPKSSKVITSNLNGLYFLCFW